MINWLKHAFKTNDCILFNGSYDVIADPLTSEEEHINNTAHKIWQVTGYHFR